jgi:hypothetical protein
MNKSVGSNLLASKQQFFIVDFFVRGATETTLAGASPYYKTYPGSNESKWPNKLVAPNEIIPAPISPYFISTRPQLASYVNYDGKSAFPIGWICRQSPLNGGGFDKAIDIPTTGNENKRNDTYWGKSIRASGNADGTNVVLFPIPRRPLLSISQLRSCWYCPICYRS